MTIKIALPNTLMTIKNSPFTIATTGALIGCIFAALNVTAANAAPEINLSQPVTGSTTVIEQSADGKVATITATPNGISMQEGMPFSVTQVTNVPRYSIHQGSTTVTTVPAAPITSQVTQQIGNTVVNTPVNAGTQVLTVTNNMPELTNQAVDNQVSSTASLDTLQRLQLQPTFSTPDIVSAQTKIMKILKNSDGREFAVPANSIASGDTIEYHTTYTNTTAQPVRDLNATVSLPNGVTLISLNSPLSTMATTGSNSYQTIQQAGNSVVVQENYSGLKWNLVDLDANAPQTVIMRATVQ